MKVLLIADIDKLGYFGDVVEVKDGYARNYLIPQGHAAVPTDTAVKSIEKERAQRAQARKLVRNQLESAASRFDGASVTVTAKANEQGHLFGSVSEKDIAENLREQGFEVANDMVRMDHGHIKELGQHDVEIRFAVDLSKKVIVTVLGQDESQDVESEELQAEETE
jgi:large subunit ribosomal protein L9